MCGADRITFLTIQFLSNNIFLFVQHYFDPHIFFFFSVIRFGSYVTFFPLHGKSWVTFPS